MSKKQIEDVIRNSLEVYFKDLRGAPPAELYDHLIGIVEKPLLEVTLLHARGNQSKASIWLGLNRNTLRKKMARQGML
jgi:Fis family transcriptional regulator, factor for inversion stimulation protein